MTHNDQTETYCVLAPGLQVGRYRLNQKIGWGGMGEVYACDDLESDRRVALKFLRADYASDGTARQRFEREAKAAASLDHPHIVQVYEVGEYAGRPYYAMEYVDGRPLRHLIDTEPVSLARAVAILLRICGGLEVAHAAGIVHRDLKPGNILLGENDHVTILDFGLARVLKDMHITEHGTAVGTANYMSPEQAEGKEIDQRADIFALGILMYELLAGVNPFARGYAPATLYAIAHDRPRPVTDLVPELPGGCRTVLDRALAKQPDQRYSTVTAFAADLKRLHDGDPITAPTIVGSAPTGATSACLAVLCLRNLGAPDDDYLSYGITEDLIIDLARVGTLRVVPMRRILAYKQSDLGFEEIARALDATLVLDGSLHRWQDRVRVSAQLVDVAGEETIWSNRWEEATDNIPYIKEALAEGILNALSVSSGVRIATGAGRPEANDPRAYEFYLRGKYMFEHKQNKSDVETSLGLFQRALEIEPSLLAARIGRARIFTHRAEMNRALEELQRVTADARKRGFKPDQAHALVELGRNLAYVAQYDRARDHLEEAIAISKGIGNVEGEIAARSELLLVHKVQGRLEGAESLFEEIMKLCSRLGNLSLAIPALQYMGWIYLNSGAADRARKLFESALTLARDAKNRSREASILTAIAATYFGRVGKHNVRTEHSYYKRAMAIWEELGEERSMTGAINNLGLALRRMGEFAAALKSFERGAEGIRRLGDTGYLAMVLSNLAETLYCLGRCDDGYAAAVEAEEAGVESGQKGFLSLAFIMKGWGKFLRGDGRQAQRLLTDATAMAAGGTFAWEEAVARYYHGLVRYHSREYVSARSCFVAARNVAMPGRFDEIVLMADMHLAAMAAQQDDTGAIEQLRQGVRRGEGTWLELPIRRLLAVSLASQSDAALRGEGRQMLADIKERARHAPYPLESNFIQSAIESLH